MIRLRRIVHALGSLLGALLAIGGFSILSVGGYFASSAAPPAPDDTAPYPLHAPGVDTLYIRDLADAWQAPGPAQMAWETEYHPLPRQDTVRLCGQLQGQGQVFLHVNGDDYPVWVNYATYTPFCTDAPIPATATAIVQVELAPLAGTTMHLWRPSVQVLSH